MKEFTNQNEKQAELESLKRDGIFYENQIKEREATRDWYINAHKPYVSDYRMEIQVEENTIAALQKSY